MQKHRVRKIRKTVDSLINDLVSHLNQINRLLTEIEQTSGDHPEV